MQFLYFVALLCVVLLPIVAAASDAVSRARRLERVQKLRSFLNANRLSRREAQKMRPELERRAHLEHIYTLGKRLYPHLYRSEGMSTLELAGRVRWGLREFERTQNEDIRDWLG